MSVPASVSATPNTIPLRDVNNNIYSRTALLSDNSRKVATTEFVQLRISQALNLADNFTLNDVVMSGSNKHVELYGPIIANKLSILAQTQQQPNNSLNVDAPATFTGEVNFTGPVSFIQAINTVTAIPSDTINFVNNSIPQAAVTNLISDLLLKAPLHAPSFTGQTNFPDGVNNKLNVGALSEFTGVVNFSGEVDFTESSISVASIPQSAVTNLGSDLGLKAPLANPSFTGTVSGITKAMVDLANVDNTSDVDKPVSSATQTELNLKAPLANPSFTGTVSGITKAMVGLSNVDNTSDVNKPVSSATQTELNLKAPLANPSFTGTVSGVTKAMVGLSNVDNTSDVNKPISNATIAELNLRAPRANPSFTGTVSGVTKDMVGLSNVDNTSDINKPVSTLQQSAIDTAVANLVNSAPGLLNTLGEISTSLNNDPNFNNTMVGLLALKAPLANPSFTGTVSGVTKAMVDLANVDNTSDANKPVSSATQT